MQYPVIGFLVSKHVPQLASEYGCNLQDKKESTKACILQSDLDEYIE